MTETSDILEYLQSQGHRITSARKAMIELFCATRKPLSADGVMRALQKKFDQKSHKVTVYRELDFLHEQGVIQHVVFEDRKKRYELAQRAHHHHLVCKKCKAVQDVQMDDDLRRVEKQIEKRKGFAISYHSLEFFGLCKSCLTT